MYNKLQCEKDVCTYLHTHNRYDALHLSLYAKNRITNSNLLIISIQIVLYKI